MEIQLSREILRQIKRAMCFLQCTVLPPQLTEHCHPDSLWLLNPSVRFVYNDRTGLDGLLYFHPEVKGPIAPQSDFVQNWLSGLCGILDIELRKTLPKGSLKGPNVSVVEEAITCYILDVQLCHRAPPPPKVPVFRYPSEVAFLTLKLTTELLCGSGVVLTLEYPPQQCEIDVLI